MAGDAALTRTMLVRAQPPEPHSSVAQRQGARLLTGTLQVRILPLELRPHRTPASSPVPQTGKPRAALGGVTSSAHESRSSSGQDAALSMLRGGFDSRTGRDCFSRGVAQLEERSVRNREAAGSSPAAPTHSAFRPTARTLARLARDEGSNPSGRTVMVLVAQRQERAAVNREMRVRFPSITPLHCSPTPLVRRSVCPTEPGGFDSHGERFAPLA
jgi:hypothetical protein